jgi:hypothetical protein
MHVGASMTDRFESVVQRSMWASHERQPVSSDGLILAQIENRSSADLSVFHSPKARIDSVIEAYSLIRGFLQRFRSRGLTTLVQHRTA